MTNKDFVKSVLPSTICSTLDQSPFGVGPEYSQEFPMYVVYATEQHSPNRNYIVGYSLISEEKAWESVAESFRQKMLHQLES